MALKSPPTREIILGTQLVVAVMATLRDVISVIAEEVVMTMAFTGIMCIALGLMGSEQFGELFQTTCATMRLDPGGMCKAAMLWPVVLPFYVIPTTCYMGSTPITAAVARGKMKPQDAAIRLLGTLLGNTCIIALLSTGTWEPNTTPRADSVWGGAIKHFLVFFSLQALSGALIAKAKLMSQYFPIAEAPNSHIVLGCVSRNPD